MSKLRPPPEFCRPLADSLAPTIDRARQTIVDLGFRAYRVVLVWVRWSADQDADGAISGRERQLEPGRIGVGRAILFCELEILPVPLVDGIDALGQTVEATGRNEQGQVTVSKISVGYTEDELMGLTDRTRDPANPSKMRSDLSFFWEVREARRAGFSIPGTAAASLAPTSPAPLRRRFVPAGTPVRKPTSFEWVVRLDKADGDRNRDAGLSGVEGR